MTDILHRFPIDATPPSVFAAVTTPEGLNQWWTLTSSGAPIPDSEYTLGFGPDYQWRALVVQCATNELFALEITDADEDWIGTQVGFTLTPSANGTNVEFSHRGWREADGHYRTSTFCWAMYLRIMKRWIEHGESVPYDRRLDV